MAAQMDDWFPRAIRIRLQHSGGTGHSGRQGYVESMMVMAAEEQAPLGANAASYSLFAESREQRLQRQPSGASKPTHQCKQAVPVRGIAATAPEGKPASFRGPAPEIKRKRKNG